MKKAFAVRLLCLVSVLSATLFAQNSTARTKIALRAAHMLDGKTDTLVSNAVIVIEGDRISAVGSGLAIPKDAKVIDLGNLTLIPGLIDSHTHLLSEMDGTNVTLQDVEMLRIVATQSTAQRALLGAKLGREDLEAGITTVRDLGNSGVNGDVALRNAINEGWLPGPRIVAATRALAAQGGQFGRLTPEAQSIIGQEYVTLHGPESARQAVRQALYDGANCIKVIVNGSPANVTLDEMKAIVDEAHLNGVKVAAHAIGEQATKTAAEAGVDSIEHAYVVSDDTLKLMAQKHIYLVPTDGTVDEFVRMSLGKRKATPEERKEQEDMVKPYVVGNRDRLQRALKFGVPIAAGSDMYLTMPDETRGQASLDMIDAYIDEGMTPLQIFHAITSSAAELLGLEKKIGTIEKDKFADILAVPGDPTKDAAVLKQAQFVMKGGQVIKQQK